MAETPEEPGPRTPFFRGAAARAPGPRVLAAGISALWLIAVAAYAAGFFGIFGEALLAPRPVAALEIALFALAAAAPPALFFYGALLAEKAEEIRREAARLSSAVDALRHATAPRGAPAAEELAAALTHATRASLAEEKAAMAGSLARLDAALGQVQATIDELQGRDSEARKARKTTGAASPEPDEAQPALPFAAEEALTPGGAQIAWSSVARALNFPRDERDEAGFAALREVVEDKFFADLLQAAEDALTALAAEGLYMEDVEVEPASPAAWRAYGMGERGPGAAEIGGVTDEVALAIVRAKTRTDPVFRDTALHFLRRFDALTARMAAELGEDGLSLDVADSRSGRAFQLLARVMGAFDGS